MQNAFNPCQYQDDFQSEIENLTIEQIDSIYKAIYSRDQSFRHKNARPLYDFQHILQIAVLIENYGYPNKDSMSREAYGMPVLCCNHNPYVFNKHFYDTFKEYYQKGILGETRFYAYLSYLHLDKFGYFYLKSTPKEDDKKSIQTLLERLKFDNQFPLSELCGAYSKERALYEKKTDSLSLIGVYKHKTFINEIDSFVLHRIDSNTIMMTKFQGYGIDSYKLEKKEGQKSYDFDSEYNPQKLHIGKNKIYIINPTLPKNNFLTLIKIRDDIDYKQRR